MFFLNKSKIYKDVIHGMITTTHISQTIIDTKIFNRLRYLKQLGNMHYVFPSTNHTRFEHSIGTYYLTGVLLENIIKHYNNVLYFLIELPTPNFCGFNHYYIIHYFSFYKELNRGVPAI